MLIQALEDKKEKSYCENKKKSTISFSFLIQKDLIFQELILEIVFSYGWKFFLYVLQEIRHLMCKIPHKYLTRPLLSPPPNLHLGRYKYALLEVEQRRGGEYIWISKWRAKLGIRDAENGNVFLT